MQTLILSPCSKVCYYVAIIESFFLSTYDKINSLQLTWRLSLPINYIYSA